MASAVHKNIEPKVAAVNANSVCRQLSQNTVYQMILTSHYKDGIEQVNVYLAACGCAPLKTAC